LIVVLEGCVFLILPVGDTEAVTSTDILHPATVKQYFTVPVRTMTHVKDATTGTLRTPLLYPMNTTFHSPNFFRPDFIDIVKDHRNNVIVGDVQFLLDFAIIGHAKCGTSTMMEWLGNHPDVECTAGETPHLALGKIGLFCKRMYNGLDADPMKLRAYKNPTDVQNLRALRLLREFFPQAKLLIGIRHPILWFQSFYNHRIQNTGVMPNPDSLAGACFKNSQNVCGDRSKFHLSLVRLGKTNYTLEHEAFTKREFHGVLKDHPPRSPNPVFLYDTQQLADDDPDRLLTFRQDLQDFLGLSHPLPQVTHYSPGKTLVNATEQAERTAKKLDICLDQHAQLRHSLLENAQRSAHYIRTYFLQAPDVTVSSPDYFLEIMDSYLQDPCLLPS
jgi:hypothetical protein